jgi:putative spermidine/putrescine transport system permease protein
MLVIVLPLLTSAVVRTFAWVVILGRQGIVNTALTALGSSIAGALAVHAVGGRRRARADPAPLMVLPVITALGNIDPNLRHASHALGAGRWRTFREVTLPLSAPGLLAGCLLVYAGSVSAFVTQTLVGGGQLMLMPQYMYQQAIQANNYPFAAAVAMILLVAVLAIVVLVNLVTRRTQASFMADDIDGHGRQGQRSRAKAGVAPRAVVVRRSPSASRGPSPSCCSWPRRSSCSSPRSRAPTR